MKGAGLAEVLASALVVLSRLHQAEARILGSDIVSLQSCYYLF
jgi:hypothetical protein